MKCKNCGEELKYEATVYTAFELLEKIYRHAIGDCEEKLNLFQAEIGEDKLMDAQDIHKRVECGANGNLNSTALGPLSIL